MTPEVSVLMPCRDAAGTLPAALASVRRQRGVRLELIAVDDGSGDATAQLLAASAAADSRVRVLSPGCRGLVAALNTGLAAARAPLVARMDADDVMHPLRLALQRDRLLAEPALSVLGCRVRAFPPRAVMAGYREYLRWQNACLTPAQIAGDMYRESPLAHPSVMFRAEAVRSAGGYRDGPFPEDYELWLRLHAAGHRFAKLDRELLAWRDWPGRTSRVDPRCSAEAFDALRARYLSRDPRLRSGRELVIWGAGRRARPRVRRLLAAGLELAGWVDIDPRKLARLLWGLPVHAPQWLRNRNPRPLVLVYVTNHGAREEIAAELEAYGYRNGADWLAVG